MLESSLWHFPPNNTILLSNTNNSSDNVLLQVC